MKFNADILDKSLSQDLMTALAHQGSRAIIIITLHIVHNDCHSSIVAYDFVQITAANAVTSV